MLIKIVTPLLALFSATTLFSLDCSTSPDLSTYLQCVSEQLISDKLRTVDSAKQAEAPAILPTSTTLADNSSAPDIVGTSLNLATLATKSRSSNSNDFSMSISMFGIYAALKRSDPLGQSFYDENREWRRLSFTFGRSFPEDLTAPASKGSATYGVKYVLSATREVADPSNSNKLQTLVGRLAATAQVFANDYAEVQNHLQVEYADSFYVEFHSDPRYSSVFENKTAKISFFSVLANPQLFQELLKRLTEADTAFIRAHLSHTIDSQATYDDEARRIVNQIKHAPQVSIGFSSRISRGTDPNLYRTELALDAAIWKVVSTTNASFDFQNAQIPMALNKEIGRFVEQGEIPLTKPASPLATPRIKLAVSGEGDWGINSTPVYKAQGKVTLHVIDGFDLPISVTYANQAKIPRADLKGQLGFTFDFGKLTKAFTSHGKM